MGARIYPWVFWNNKRIMGREGAAIPIEQQQKGIEMLTARGILVKVNSVMIPGVNDAHLAEVSKVVKSKGAFLHNVMPLIAEPEHGTFYGLMGQASPTPEELQALQDACSGDMNMMRHCRQCRADAVGLLGEDRGLEFTLDKIEDMEIDYAAAMVKRAEVHAQIARKLAQKEQDRVFRAEARAALRALRGEADAPATRPVLMAVSTNGGGVINEHFGHAHEFLVYEASPAGVRFIGHRKTTPCTRKCAPPASSMRWPSGSRKSPEEDAMSLEIIESCVNCYACEPLCPNDAIYQAAPHFLIDPDKCTECLGDFDDAQCASICPIEGAIVDELGVALNLPGSLTGISAEMLARYQAAVEAAYQARAGSQGRLTRWPQSSSTKNPAAPATAGRRCCWRRPGTRCWREAC